MSIWLNEHIFPLPSLLLHIILQQVCSFVICPRTLRSVQLLSSYKLIVSLAMANNFCPSTGSNCLNIEWTGFDLNTELHRFEVDNIKNRSLNDFRYGLLRFKGKSITYFIITIEQEEEGRKEILIFFSLNKAQTGNNYNNRKLIKLSIGLRVAELWH